jgi:hypothetical protein
MEQWIGDRQQIDDFLVMGVKLAGLGKHEEQPSKQPQKAITK